MSNSVVTYDDLELSVPFGNKVYVIGDQVYDDTGITTGRVLQYNGTNWVLVDPSSLGTGGSYGTPGTGTSISQYSINKTGPVQNVGSLTQIALISAIPNASNDAGYRMVIRATGALDKSDEAQAVSVTWEVIQTAGALTTSTTPKILSGPVKHTAAVGLQFNTPTLAFSFGTSVGSNDGTIAINYNGSGVTGGSNGTHWNVTVEYVLMNNATPATITLT